MYRTWYGIIAVDNYVGRCLGLFRRLLYKSKGEMDEKSPIAPNPNQKHSSCGSSPCTCAETEGGYVNEALDVESIDTSTFCDDVPKQMIISRATDIFCQGARFDGIAKPVIAPPPPGCAPNAIQLMYAKSNIEFIIQDQKTKKKKSWHCNNYHV